MTTMLPWLIVFAALSIFGITSSMLLLLRLRKLSRRLELQAAVAESEKSGNVSGGFSPVLRQADLQSRLQQGWQRREMPEKYRFVRTLAERGVPAAEIAGILHLSPGETDQLVALAGVAGRQALPVAKSSRAKRGRPRIQAKDFPATAEMIVSDR